MSRIIPILTGFPGRTSRGFLGWSSIYLIESESDGQKTYMLFDTGGYNERHTLLDKLASLKICPEDIRFIVLSHLHFDHSANWTLFPKAKILIHPTEMQYALNRSGDLAVLDFHAEALRNSRRLVEVRENDELFDGCRFIETPGHTPGSIALLVDQSHLLVSDALKNRKELINGPARPVWDEQVAWKTIEKIKQKANTIYPGHDVPIYRTEAGWKSDLSVQVTIHLAQGFVFNTGDVNHCLSANEEI